MEIYLWSGGLFLVAVLWMIMIQGQFHLLAAIMLGMALLIIASTDKATAVVLTFAYLFLMGDIRRIISLAAPQPSLDPLLLVGPVMAATLAIPQFQQLRLNDSLSKAMLALLAVMALEVFNPSQGGLAIGLSGAFFYIVPVLWFWVGRSLGSPNVVRRLIYQVLLPLALLASLMGLYQTFVGFLPYQRLWINSAVRVLTSLYVGSSIRAFGFSVSGSEYATLLEFGVLASVSAFLARRRAWILLLPPIFAALILASARGYVVRTIFALSIACIVKRSARISPATLVAMVLIGVLSLAGLSYVASKFAPSEEQSPQHTTAAQNEIAHQLGGLGHPFDSRYSTAGTHADMVMSALTIAVTHPIGLGLGYTTFAAEKLTGSSNNEGSSEIDLSDMFKAIGIVGGSIYLWAAFAGLKRAFQYCRLVPLQISLPTFALVIATFGNWLVGGQYSTSSLLFFLLGALVHHKKSSLRSGLVTA